MTRENDAVAVAVDSVWKSYAERRTQPGTAVLEGFSLDVQRGEVVSLLGPNACGKSTLLRVIAGLQRPDRGSILVGGESPDKAKIGLVFQNFSDSLLPWLSNLQNIAFPHHRSLKDAASEELRDRLAELHLGMIPLSKYPYQCSVGQQQLVALAREVLADPEVLLLDEPFAALDLENRLTQQENLARICERQRLTTILVSHDLDEAIRLADRVVVLSARPAQVVGEFQIDLPRPRNLSDLASPHYLRLKAPILEAFQKATRR